MVAYLWKYLRTYQTIVWLALIGLTTVAVVGVSGTVKHLVSEQFLVLAWLALLCGWFVAAARLPSWLGALSVTSLGIEYILLDWAGLGGPLGRALQTLGDLLGQWISQPAALPDFTPLIQRFAEIDQALLVILTRILNWQASLGVSSVIDPLIPQLIWGLALWLAITFLAWATWTNRQPLAASLPTATLLALAVFFSADAYEDLALFLLFMILLQAAALSMRRQRSWERQKIDYADSLSQDLALTVIPIAMLIAGIAFVVPTISINKIAQEVADIFSINNPQADAYASSFGINQGFNPVRRAGLSGLPRSHLLGDNPDLSRELVMTIRTGELPPTPIQIADEVEVPRHYWQAVTYDTYNSYGWVFRADEGVTLPAETLLLDPEGPGHVLTQTVARGKYSSDLLHTSGPPLWLDRQIQATYRSDNDLAVATVSQNRYVAASWVHDITPTMLRNAGTDYPLTIRRTYLGLPASLPDRVRDLALSLTATEPTPYDKAIALESYLREFPYNLEVTKPPFRTDVADYFLFELQEGYCDYYATSMVVMARAIGLPARFVIGYVSGGYDYELAEYRVTEADAHSWAQIYFPQIGWVDFEPTAGRPAIERQDEITVQASSNGAFTAPARDAGPSPGNSPKPFQWPTVHPFWWGALTLLLFFVIVNFDYWRLRLLGPKKLTTLLYRRLVTIAGKTGLAVHPGWTPYEFARAFTGHIERELPRSRLARFRVREFWRREIQPIDEPSFTGIREVARIFVYQQYAPPQTQIVDKGDLLDAWEELQPNLRRAGRILRLTRRYANLLRRSSV